MMPSTRAVTHSFARATTHGTLVDVVRIVRPRAPTVGAGHLAATREQQRRRRVQQQPCQQLTSLS